MEHTQIQWLLTIVALIGSAGSVAGLTLKLGRLLQSHDDHGQKLEKHGEAIEDLKMGQATLTAKVEAKNAR